MLRELRVKNLAVIENATVTLAPGLNVLTGETGAGKSMLVDALALLMGERANADLIRSGADRAVVEAEFENAGTSVGAFCEEAGVDLDDGRLVVRRELNVQGRNRVWAGGGPATVAVLSGLGERLVDLHGQHESQSLLRAVVQRRILDEYADGGEAASEVRQAFGRLQDVTDRIDAVQAKFDDVKKRVDYLRHVADEISEARLVEGEDAALEIEARRLSNVETITNVADAFVAMLDEDEASAGHALGAAARLLEELARVDDTVVAWSETLDSAIAEVEEVARMARDYVASIETDPDRLQHVEARRDIIFRLSQKYGPAIRDVLDAGDEARRELDILDTAGLDLSQLRDEKQRLAAELEEKARALTAARSTAALKIAAAVTSLIGDLGLPDGQFMVELQAREQARASGAEEIVFLVRLNRGMPARPLSRVASGGELSRLMLALKVALAEQDAIPTLIFDEVDQGIGGEIANALARSLAQVGANRQVLVITHLAQIAAVADHHLIISKDPHAGIARATVTELSGPGRVDEIARMLGGTKDAVIREHARELLGRNSAGGQWVGGSVGRV